MALDVCLLILAGVLSQSPAQPPGAPTPAVSELKAPRPVETTQTLKNQDTALEKGLAGPAAADLSSVLEQKMPIIGSFDAWLRLAAVNGVSKASGENASLIIGSSRIVGGGRFEWLPEIAAILYADNMHCSGTIIAPSTVLTAAHCVQGYDVKRMQLAIGPNAWRPIETFRIVDGAVHPDYSRVQDGRLENDIALLYLERPYTAERKVMLPSSRDDSLMSGAVLAFIGYGYALNSDGVFFRLGHKARVDMRATSLSSTAFSYGTEGKNTCNGDSGGPALLLDEEGRYLLMGTTSYGDQYCTRYGVDMRVDAYLEWINSNTRPAALSRGGQ